MKWEKERFTVIERVRETLDRWPMFAPDEEVLVAVSGGGDSLVLLDVLCELACDLGIKPRVIHVDHGLRPESAEEASFVKRVAGHYGMPCRAVRVSVDRQHGELRLSPEEAAREARYQAFEEELARTEASRLALGHTADDRVETFLLRMIKGSGPAGLGSIPPVRLPYVRPLIQVWRKEIRAYEPFLPFSPIEDPSNRDLSIPRNRIRHELLPLLEDGYNPSVRRALLREADILADLGELLEALSLQAEEKDVNVTARGLEINLQGLRAHSPAIQRQLLAACLRQLRVEPGFELIENIRQGMMGSMGNPSQDVGHGLVAHRSYDRLILGPRPEVMPPDEMLLEGEGSYYHSSLGLRLELRSRPRGGKDPKHGCKGPKEAWLDADRLSFPLKLRGIRHGDRFHPLGAPGTRKMQDFLVDLKVPREERSGVAVLESAGEIVWVVGLRIDDRFKVDEDTRRVAEIVAEWHAG
jgi:tRNA(Ile)-lysidine synthase